MTLLAILTAIGLILNVLLAVAVIRSVGDIQKRIELREHLDASWRDSMMERVRRLESKPNRNLGGQAHPKQTAERRNGNGR